MMPALILWATIGASTGAWHPVHASSALITYSEAARRAEITLKVFEEDFPARGDSTAISRYLVSRFRLTLSDGRGLPITLVASRREGPMLVLALRAAAPEGLSGCRVWHGVLTERFSDQVNVVQARYGGRAVSLVFTGRDGPRPLP